MINKKFMQQLMKVLSCKTKLAINLFDINLELKRKYPDMIEEDFDNLFYRIVWVLYDEQVIEPLIGKNLGLKINEEGELICSDCFIRLTSKGYDFADAIQRNGFLEKVGELTLSGVLLCTKAWIEEQVKKL